MSVSSDSRSFQARPSLDDVCRWIPLVGFAAYLLSVQVHPHDLWWHLRSGQLTLADGWITSVDRFSFTRSGEVWLNQSWLMQLALYGLFQLGGLTAVRLGHVATITAGYTLLTAALRTRFGTPAAMLAGIAAFFVGAVDMGVRPQAVSFLCFGALVAAIELHRDGRPRALRWTPLLFVVWVNAHAAFLFGDALLGLYVLERTWTQRRQPDAGPQIRELWLIAAGACAALALTPEGPRVFLAYFGGFFAHTFELVDEFQPLHVRELDGVLFFTVLAATIAALWRSQLRPAPDQIVALVGFGLAALSAKRFSAWFGFVLAPVLAAALARLRSPDPLPSGHRARNALYFAVAAALVVASVVRARDAPDGVSAETPLEASALLCRTAPDGARVFQEIGFASYQIFHCPRLPVFVDPRIELYPRSQWDEYFAVASARYDWEEILERWRISHVLVPSEDESFGSLRAAIAASSHWTELHRDATAVLWSRAAPRAESSEAGASR